MTSAIILRSTDKVSTHIHQSTTALLVLPRTSAMAAHDKARWHPPLKAPAIEVVDLLSDSDSIDTAEGPSEHKAQRDAYSTVFIAQEKTEKDVQWREPLKAPGIELDDSLSRDVSAEMGKVPENGEDAKARDASAEGSDSDEDSQWSLYEDALGEDEEEVTLIASMLFQSIIYTLQTLTRYAQVTAPVLSKNP